MGKHASSGTSSHPLVAGALAQRSGTHGAHREGLPTGYESPLGWPAPPPSPGTGGLGWPGDLRGTNPAG